MTAVNVVEVQVHELCLICLTETTDLLHLNSPLFEDENPRFSILHSLQKVMCCKVEISERYPCKICQLCKSLLKVAHNLHIVFYNSQRTLSHLYTDVTELKNDPPVELLSGDYKFNLNDVVIIVEDETEKEESDELLESLATSVSENNDPEEFVININTGTNTAPKTLVSAVNKKFTETPCIITDASEGFQYEAVLEDPLNVENSVLNSQKEFSCRCCGAVFAKKHRRREHVLKCKLIHPLLSKPAVSVKKETSENLEIVPENQSEDILKTETVALDTEDLDLKSETVSQSETVQQGFKCRWCLSVSSSKYRHRIHVKQCNIKQKSAGKVCKNCGKRVVSVRVKCAFCGYKPVRKIPYKPTLCDLCGHVSDNLLKARIHRAKHEKTFECHLCPKKFYHKISLNLHIKNHSKVRPNLCNICGKDFFWVSSLVYHMRIHTNEKKYVCEYCDQRFKMVHGLKRHLFIHTGERPYVCQYCDKGFRSSGEMKRHEMRHTGERPFECQFCEKGFIKKYDLAIHYRSHPGPHGCDFCKKTFLDVEFLKKHVQDAHKDVEENDNVNEHLDDQEAKVLFNC